MANATFASIEERLIGYAQQPLFQDDWGSVVQPSTFVWQHGTTPLSHVVGVATLVGGYVGLSFGIQAVMANRKPMDGPLFTRLVVLHNIILSLGSLIMAVGAVYSISRISSHYDSIWDPLACDSKGVGATQEGNLLHWWLYVFYLSKFYEMIDTFVLALKKKPLTFLQMYHHAVVALLVWSWLEARLTLAWFGMTANTIVHTFMYYYFGCQALKIRVWWKQWVTVLQLVQFACNLTLITNWILTGLHDLQFHLSWPIVSYSKSTCQGEPFAILFSQTINFSFLVLFTELFVRLYFRKKAKAV